MIRKLTILNLKSDYELPLKPQGEIFYIKTCQRQILAGFSPELGPYLDCCDPNQILDHQTSRNAYTFLLETLCGLKSRLQGENEIVGQFRQAFKDFLSHENKNKALIPIFEKLLKDGKEIRTHYLRDISQLSYSGLARQFIQRQKKQGPVAILGSGQLAEDLIKVLAKKYDIIICARNEERVSYLTQKDRVEALPFDQLSEVYKNSLIVNTIPCTKPFISEEKVEFWKENTDTDRLFIDLASPTVFDHDVTEDSAIKLLADLFDLGENISSLKEEKIERAKEAITQLSHKRFDYFKIDLPLSREELKFA